MRPDDIVQDEGGFRIVLDGESAGWLRGARLDHRETLLESGFKFDNPNVKNQCGCGESFSV